MWSEVIGDEEVETEFDPTARYEPPWFGFVPRLLAVDLVRPFKPTFALWREGHIIEAGAWTVDRREYPGRVRPVLALTEKFADFCRERNLFGAYFVTFDLWAHAACAAVAAALIREADWCGMFVLEPAACFVGGPSDRAERLASWAAGAVKEGLLSPPGLVARRRRRVGPAPRLDLPLERAGVAVGQGGGEAEEQELDQAGAARQVDAGGVGDQE